MNADRQYSIFHLFALAGLVFGAVIGAWTGADRFGSGGGLLGAVAGGVVGYILGRMPGRAMSRMVARYVASMSSEELRACLQSGDCCTPNYVLVELQFRGEDIQREIQVVLDLLVSEDIYRRIRGWAALNSAFPTLAEQISEYSIEDTVAECRRKTGVLRPEAVENFPYNVAAGHHA